MSNTKTWDQYRAGLAYQSSMGFPQACAMHVRFKEGDQWPAPTERTKNMPRPVFNIVDFIVRAKRSSVLDQPASIAYRPTEEALDELETQIMVDGAKHFTDYAHQLWKAMDMDKLNNEAVDDAATNGTGIWHFYWDADVKGGGITPYFGELRGETIDQLNLFVSNPQQKDIQKQEYIIISKRMPVEDVKRMAKAAGLSATKIAEINSDKDSADETYDSARKEVDGEGKITLLTKYYRKDGEVVYDRCTKCVEIIKERPLTPAGSQYRIKKYPVAVMNWKYRKKCFYGIGEVEGLIPNQKAINFNIAMELYAVQQTGFPKVISKPNAIKQPITNEPGEHIIDYYGNGNGISYLNPPASNGAGTALADKIVELTRVITGSTEVATGEAMGANMAASAIIALQNQAKTPVNELQRHFWWALEDTGRIWEEFFKTYYNMPRAIAVEDIDSESGIEASQFTGTDYAGMDFSLQVDVGASSQYSAVLAQATLDKFLDAGYITPDQYIELSDPNVVPFKSRYKRMMEQQMQEIPMAATGMEAGVEGYQPAHGIGGVQLPDIPKAPDAMSAFKGVI